jgi:DNA primase
MRFETSIRETFVVTNHSGSEFQCMCRWHADTSSGHLYVNGVSGLYLCFSCGAKGSLANLTLPRYVVGSDDVREKARKIRAGRPRQKFYPEGWLSQFDVQTDYWTHDRTLPENVVQQFRLGFDPFTGHATLPLRDDKGRVLGVTHRKLDGSKPKYQHPKGFPVGGHLYGAWLLTNQRTVALVEGQVDAIRGWSHDVPALSMMGNRITRDQIRVLQRHDVRTAVLMLDRDTPGVKGVVQINESLKGSGIRVRVGWYRPYWFVKDPDGLNRTRYRKMFYSALNVYEWAELVQAS